MIDRKISSRIAPYLLTAMGGTALLASACIDEEPGILDGSNNTTGATSGRGGMPSNSAGTPSAGTKTVEVGGQASAGAPAVTPDAGKPSGGGGNTNGGSAVTSEGGAGGVVGEGDDGTAGEPGESGEPQVCLFHSDATGEPMGEGGAGPAPTITLQTSPFVGSYLADGAGRTLFVYGNDLPGDCRADNQPKSRCEADCPVSWPPFDAGARVLGPGLSDAAFGSIQRSDGLWQTTYYGWPLYYYKNDLTVGQMTGQGKGKTWHVAETTPASIVIMKEGAVKYLADGAGYTLYVSAADTVGSESADPVSACSGECLQKFKRFHQKHPSLVPSLEQQEFSVFVADSVELQLAFRGHPLYRARSDARAGDTTGTATPGFTVAIP
jgi:predicted lipoprotein with Yx(FWY)xxD motif